MFCVCDSLTACVSPKRSEMCLIVNLSLISCLPDAERNRAVCILLITHTHIHTVCLCLTSSAEVTDSCVLHGDIINNIA